MSPETAHLSIGEVLAQLRDEFPDITISKIRFLESQGLIDPERTPSGYRKFYDDDLARLRWILFQQKEHFLPLKVIKERLDEIPPGDLAALEPRAAESTEPPETTEASDDGPAPTVTVPTPTPSAPKRRTRSRAPAFAPVVPLDDIDPEGGVIAGGSGDDTTYSLRELAEATGLELEQCGALESFGLLAPAREEAGEARYDDDALEIAGIAAGFFARGVEARHLRMYRTFAEREAVLFAQVLLPYARQRNPDARARIQDELVELATLGRRLRTALLREAARETLAE